MPIMQEVKREDWMLELPTDKAKSFGLGPRTFSRKGSAATGGDRYGTYRYRYNSFI